MKKILLIAFIGTMLLSVASCSTTDEKTSTPVTTASKTDLLTAKKWRVTALTYNGTDAYATMDACDKDDLHIFKVGGVYNADNGPTKCTPTDDQIFTISTWAFSENDTKLTFDNDTFTVVELTATTMKLSIVDNSGSGTITFVGQ